MNGLFGWYEKESRAGKADLLKQYEMSLPPKHILSFETFKERKTCLGLSRLNYGELIKSVDGRFAIAVYGAAYDEQHRQLNTIQLIKRLSGAHKPSEALAGLNGCFCGALFNIQKDRLFLFTDPFGNLPIYYNVNQNSLYFSCYSQPLRENLSGSDWDETGLLQYLTLGFGINGRTFYRDIRRIPGATLLSFDVEGLRLIGYRSYTQKREKQSFSNVYQIIRDDLRCSVQGKAKNAKKVASALTGGYDSRVTWAILKHCGMQHRALAHTHGLKDSRDMTIAAKICRRFGLEHLTIPFDEALLDSLPMLWQQTVEEGEGLLPAALAHALHTWRTVAKNANTILDSHGGALYRRQVMKGAARFIDMRVPLAPQFLPWFSTGLEKSTVTSKTIAQKMKQACLPELEEFLQQKLALSDIGQTIDAFYRDQISVHKYSAAAAVQTRYIHFEHPFLSDRSVLELNRLDDKSKKRQLIYRRMISDFWPELKNFGLENMGLPAPYRGFTFWRYGPMAWEKALSYLPETIHKKLTLRRFVSNYDLFFSMHADFVNEVLLQPHTLFFDLFERDVLEKQLMEESLNVSIMSSLLTFKMFLHRFHPTA